MVVSAADSISNGPIWTILGFNSDIGLDNFRIQFRIWRILGPCDVYLLGVSTKDLNISVEKGIREQIIQKKQVTCLSILESGCHQQL